MHRIERQVGWTCGKRERVCRCLNILGTSVRRDKVWLEMHSHIEMLVYTRWSAWRCICNTKENKYDLRDSALSSNNNSPAKLCCMGV